MSREAVESLRSGLSNTDPEPTYTAPERGAQDHFENGEYFAAIKTARDEITASSTDSPIGALFDLWYVRVQSLLILQQGQQAAEEILRSLSTLDTDNESITMSSCDRLKAWRLRILTVPVKTKGVNQNAVQQYYNLAAEARAAASVLPDNSAQKQKWLDGIEIAGQYAVSTLIAMRDYDSAIRLLKLHYNVCQKSMLVVTLLALLFISVGDTLGAQPWLEKIEDKGERHKLQELCVFTDNDSRPLSNKVVMRGLEELYEGKIDEAIVALEEKVADERTQRGLILASSVQNLAVLYSICHTDPEPQYAALRKRLGDEIRIESTDVAIRRLMNGA